MIKSAISQGVVSTAKLMHKVYLATSQLATTHPKGLAGINTYIVNPIRSAVSPLVNFNAQTLGWNDLFNIWLFELGGDTTVVNNSPAYLINGITNIQSGTNMSHPEVNAVKNLSSVVELRGRVKNKLSNGELTTNGEDNLYYIYNTNEYYGSLAEQNKAKIFLGSFNTNAYILNKNSNSATVVFIIQNVSGWESATRFIKAEGRNVGIINDKARGTGLNLGGNFGQWIQWTETVTW